MGISARTREAVSVIFTLSFTRMCKVAPLGRAAKGRARMEGQSPPLAIDLHRKSNAEHLVAYITTHHESFLALLPHRYKGTGTFW